MRYRALDERYTPSLVAGIVDRRMLPAGIDAAVAPGTVIAGKYRVEALLGMGGMGVVVAARHLELDQPLAIKVLLPSVADDEVAMTRFVREGRSAARLTSPYVAKVYDTGQLPSGAPYLVMELLRGRDLRAHLAEARRVPLAQAIEWTVQAAHALGEAHAQSIIHRDVKPANLFLAETSAGQQIKVLDFGVSKRLDSTEADLTKTTAAVGTPRYMAPEQMRSPRLADARGDVWSLGVVLYELTTGEPPFRGDSVTALCFDVMERTPTPPSQLSPELPAAFDDVVLRCLEKDPSDRYTSMHALATALLSITPATRASGLFDPSAWAAASSTLGATPVSVPSDLHLAAATRRDPETEPLTRPPVSEQPHQETMRAWDTTAVPRTAGRRGARLPLVLLGVGIGVGAATLAGMLVGDRDATPTGTIGSIVITPPTASAPSSPVVAAADPPPVASVSASAPAVAPSSHEPPVTAAPPKVVRPNCTPPYTIDERGHRHAKPQCLR